MNLVLLVGNGFDVKLGMKTRYPQFYEWYKERPHSKSFAVNLFRKDINVNSEDWADLEKAVGIYHKNLSSEVDSKAIFDDLLANLRIYLLSQYDRFDFTDQSADGGFINHFFNPSETFYPASRSKIRKLQDFAGSDIYTKIIVFNYTNTLEDLIGWKGERKDFPLHGHTRSILDIEHIHGYIDGRGRMALGVDSPEQIHNDTLCKSRKVTRRFVKPEYNECYEELHQQKCVDWLYEANAYFIFGMSLGETDKRWWRTIGEQLAGNPSKVLIVHIYNPSATMENNMGVDYQERLEEDQLRILRCIDQEENEDLLKQIFITYSDKVFGFSTYHDFKKQPIIPQRLTLDSAPARTPLLQLPQFPQIPDSAQAITEWQNGIRGIIPDSSRYIFDPNRDKK